YTLLTADALDHHGRRRAREGPARNPGREASRRATGHDDADVRGLAELGHRASRHDGARLLPDELSDVALRPAVARNRARVLGPDHAHGVGEARMRVARDNCTAARNAGQHLPRRAALRVRHYLKRLRGHRGHRALLRGEAVLDVERLPRALLLVLADAV